MQGSAHRLPVDKGRVDYTDGLSERMDVAVQEDGHVAAGIHRQEQRIHGDGTITAYQVLSQSVTPEQCLPQVLGPEEVVDLGAVEGVGTNKGGLVLWKAIGECDRGLK